MTISDNRRAASMEGSQPLDLEGLAKYYLAKKDYLKAAELLQQAFAEGILTSGLLNCMAECFLALGDAQSAGKLISKSLNLDAEQSEARNLLKRLETRSTPSSPSSMDDLAKKNLRVGFVTLWYERGHAYVTKMMRDALAGRFDTFVFARNGGTPDLKLLATNGEWAVPNLTTHSDYNIPQRVFAEWLVRNRPDVVIFNEEYHLRLVKASKESGARTIGYYVWELFPVEYVEACNELFDVILCQTDACYRYFSQIGLKNLVRLTWGIDRGIFFPSSLESTGPVRFFHPAGWGGMHERRGTRDVIDAFKAANIPEARLIIHTQEGRGKEEDGPITIHHGTVSREELASLYRNADVAVLPSKWEGLGLTFLESIGCGLPIITVNAPPMNEFVKDGESGFLCQVKTWESYPDIFVKAAFVDIEDLASKMRLIMDPRIRLRMKQNTKPMADSYNIHSFHSHLGDLLETLARRPVKLNLSCGTDTRDGYINVDFRPRMGVDVVADAAHFPFRQGSISEILANDNLGQFPFEFTDRVLSEWKRLLEPGGILKIQCPDMRQLARAFVLNRLPVQEFWRRAYGGHDHDRDYRFATFDIPEMKRRLRSSRFQIKEISAYDCCQAITAHIPHAKKGPLRILLISARFSNYPWGTGNFIHKALTGLGHQVVDIDFRRDHDRLETLLQEQVDLVLVYKGSGIPPRLLEMKSCPVVLWYPDDVLTQTHAIRDISQNGYAYDHIYYFDQAGVPFLKRMGLGHSSFLPLATDPLTYRYLPETPKIYDVSFIGNIYPNRRALLDRLKSRFNVFETTAYMDEMVRITNQSRIVLNLGVGRSGYQLRVFEALGCHAFLLTNEIAENERLFRDREHLVYFDDRNIEELIAFYLSHEEEREAIAEAGYREVLAKHTFEARMKQIISELEPPAVDDRNILDSPSNADLRSRRMSSGATPRPKNGSKDDPRVLSVEVHPCVKNLARPLRILAAFAHFNWEDHNLQPALQEFGEVVRLRWPANNQYAENWHASGKQALNLRLLQEVKSAHEKSPLDLFFGYLSGRLVFPSTIRAIAAMGIPTINIFLDDRHKFYGRLEPTGFAGMVDIANVFTLCCTSSEHSIPLYHTVGAEVIYLPEGANPDIYRPQDTSLDIDVSFVGQCYGMRAEMINSLRSKGITVEVFGKGWPSGEIPVEEMVRIYSRSRINLGFGFSGESDNTMCLKGRDFEIPMSGGFYLTQYHQELDNVYQIGEEIACYLNVEDLAEKIKFYLARPDRAEAIRRAGRRRALKDHTWTNRLSAAFSAIGLPGFSSEAGKRRNTPKICTGYGELIRKSFHSAISGQNGAERITPETSDDHTYYARVGERNALAKRQAIKEYVLSKNDIHYLLDVGCNTGEMSAGFMQNGIEVLGLDASDRLPQKQSFPFLKRDITNSHEVILSDCTLFLSLYHHILWSKGIEFADTLFFRLLLRTGYLVFDCGNVHENSPYRQRWLRAMKQHFASEKELLDHFEIPYTIIGTWETGGAARSIVVFERNSFDEKCQVMDEFRRKCWSPTQKEGLFPISRIDNPEHFFDKTRFYKLRLGNRFFFAKKHLPGEWEVSELRNLIDVYSRFPRDELLEFYGVSGRFGLIYEWVDTFKYLGKVRDEWIHGILLQDADRIEIDGKVKYIDFWSDPLKGPVQKDSGGSIEKWIREGERAYAAGDSEKAGNLFQKALNREPNRCDAINNLGVIAFEQGRLDLAESLFLKAHALFPFHADAIENIARCYEKMGNYPEALKWFRKVLESGSPSVEILNKTGNCLMQLEDLDGARKVYEESLKQDGNQESIRTILNGIEEMRSFQGRVPISSEGKQ